MIRKAVSAARASDYAAPSMIGAFYPISRGSSMKVPHRRQHLRLIALAGVLLLTQSVKMFAANNALPAISDQECLTENIALNLCRDSLDRTITNASKAIDSNQTNAEAFIVRSKAYVRKGDHERAIADASRAIEIKPEEAETYIIRARAFVGKQDYERGMADTSKAIEINPATAEAYHLRAYAYSKGIENEATKRALAEASKAIQLNARDSEAYVRRAEAYLAMGDNHWVADLSKAHAIDADVELRMTDFWKRVDYGSAIADYTKALEIDPKRLLSYVERAIAYERNGHYDDAIADLKKILELRPGSKPPSIYFSLANLYKTKRDYDSAIAEWSKIIEVQNDAFSYDTRGTLYAQKHDYRRAITDFNKAIELAQDDFERSDYYYDRAEAYEAMGNRACAAADTAAGRAANKAFMKKSNKPK